uniref:Zinc finger protein Pegasus n=1 Tax=Hucho hucho TaxID=62062 RepID=A0A4W5L2F8_9TELE
MDDELKPLDFIKDFQEYLTQQTHHVNMISGSVGGEIEPDHLQAVAAAIPESDNQNGSVEVSLDDSSGLLLVDGFQRTFDGKLKCSYCSYASKGTARLIEHIRIHTGEKPHRCQLCPFASAYERHLEAHMRSHTGEKPYKCDLCSFRCSDRSNLSHHRRRRHKLLPMKGAGMPSFLSNKKMLNVLQKKSDSSLGLGGYSRHLLVNFSPPSMVVGKPDYLNHEVYESNVKDHGTGGGGGGGGSSRDVNSDMVVDSNPLKQRSTLAGQLSNLLSVDQAPVSPDRVSSHDVKPFLIQQASGAPIAVSVSLSTSQSGAHHHHHYHHHHHQTSSPTSPQDLQHPAGHSRNYSPSPVDPEPSSEHSAHTRTSSASISNSQPSSPALPGSTQDPDPQMLHSCQHCDTYFSDNIMYTIHMGCHGYENPFQCNICGCKCRNKYDFACHFARGQHQQ